MTQKIYEIKDRLLDEVKNEVESGNVNLGELNIMADVIKDLAEAEHHCWEACYYKAVVEGMEGDSQGKMGYYGPDGSGVGSNAPQRSGYSTMMGYNGKGQSGGSRMSGRSGYNDQTIENIRQIMETSDPMRKEQLKQDLMRMMQEVGI